MKNLAIIPARGGSKRIPRKNIKDFMGKPIIAYSIEVALKSDLFEEVMVSTDDEEIAEVAIKYGAKVPFIRSKEMSNDYATLADDIDEVKEQYLKLDNTFENICCILATAPLLSAYSLKKGFEILNNNNVDSVRPVVRFSYPIQRALCLDGDNKANMFYPEYQNVRSQDLVPAFHDAGQFYWMRYNLGLRGTNKYGFEISGMFVQDIDTEDDWAMAELKYKILSLL